ncbi:hypothetical protein [Streptomyces albogriseolus]|uniref:hypothetical protein n=1 Tax=Streptomyces albogriseolus TaxID=1887 RepID=UPI0033A49DC1
MCTAAESRMLIFQASRPVLLAVVDEPLHGAALAGLQLVRLFDDLNTARLPTWAWPLPGGASRWHRIAREVTAGRWRPRG